MLGCFFHFYHFDMKNLHNFTLSRQPTRSLTILLLLLLWLFRYRCSRPIRRPILRLRPIRQHGLVLSLPTI
jgi:hypothetical protein